MAGADEIIELDRRIISKNSDGTIRESYREVRIGKTIYRITRTFQGKIDLGKALERLAVNHVLAEMDAKLKETLRR